MRLQHGTLAEMKTTRNRSSRDPSIPPTEIRPVSIVRSFPILAARHPENRLSAGSRTVLPSWWWLLVVVIALALPELVFLRVVVGG